MKFGLFGTARTSVDHEAGANDSQAYREFIDYVCEAERLGFSSVFLAEHHFTGINQISASISLLTYLAGITKTIRLGTAVTVLPWHNPVLLAEQAATLDVLSNGRFDFGVGKGYRETEFDGFCMDIAEAHERYEEALEIILRAWTSKERFSHHGKRWHYEDIIVEPSPAQQPHPPLWVGASSAASVKRAGEQGMNLLMALQVAFDEVIALTKLYRESLAESGHPRRLESVGLLRAVHVCETPEEVEEGYDILGKFLITAGSLAGAKVKKSIVLPSTLAENRKMLENAALIGTPADIVAKVRKLQAGGIDSILLLNLSGSRNMLRAFAAEVMPHFEERRLGRTA
ncbi:alkanesulfonate monooxygenase SsuD/methylene tetrahydromethanopterin reductase-like flavin-dependent oxidoreductase (luciferase family) [Rhodoligotrophos appendicifer]|uniref:LLM class flavin-dependent oxidoreductase n=1 Tax=Rhodoligotrophos appendicifer TaxID=987056 RepID=UPI001184E563|nr:LLM class flavin-dependent oxidoreductase [Rhodoligotrophos appendicifer]